jgi:hypothetical protein
MSKEIYLIFKPTAVTLYIVERFYFAKMKNQKKNDLHIHEPVVLHILSYMHNSLCKLISNSLSAYAAYEIKEKEKKENKKKRKNN